jgi:hypothetical protein
MTTREKVPQTISGGVMLAYCDLCLDPAVPRHRGRLWRAQSQGILRALVNADFIRARF